MSASPSTCAVIGSGNVAYSLIPALEEAGIKVLQVYSRSGLGNTSLPASEDIEIINVFDKLCNDADIYIVSVKDDAIQEVAEANRGRGGLWVHTSGSVGKDALSIVSSSYGVLYPMQTFTKGLKVDFSEVPIFVEGSDEKSLNSITDLSKKLSRKVIPTDSEKRARIHAAAVFACNFVNFLWTTADDVLKPTGEELDILYPLIKETWEKIHKTTPRLAQTGPARRGDKRVVEKHLKLLTEPQAEIYSFLTDRIMDYYGIKGTLD